MDKSTSGPALELDPLSAIEVFLRVIVDSHGITEHQIGKAEKDGNGDLALALRQYKMGQESIMILASYNFAKYLNGRSHPTA